MSKDNKWKLSPKARVIPKDQRRQYPPEAFDSRNTKVRITIYIDLDVLNYFKAHASKDGTPYQTQINAVLRQVVEKQDETDPGAQLRQAKGLIDAALRKIG